MNPPPGGATVRMYRQGHGDCFLIGLPRPEGGVAHLLIDCGMKRGSEMPEGPTMLEVIADIRATTGGVIDVLAVTHEHEDHLSAFLAPQQGADPWEGFEFRTLWLGWTEDAEDPHAEALRREFDDTLIVLDRAAEKLKTIRNDPEAEATRQGVRELLGFEAAFGAVSKTTMKQALARLRDRAQCIEFLSPGDRLRAPAGDGGARVYTLGPPRDRTLLLSLDPRRKEEFAFAQGLAAERGGFAAAFDGASSGGPFGPGVGSALGGAGDGDAAAATRARYDDPGESWRRVDGEWLQAAGELALRLNTEVNNTSLVLAIELSPGGAVLLFTGDAQRGSWISWADVSWTGPDGATVSARDLLGRVALYKVGHHGSHNATLKGSPDDAHPNLSWFGRPPFDALFAAMIPAHAAWAQSKRWRHPLAAIEQALHAKAAGRVVQADMLTLDPPSGHPPPGWADFGKRVRMSPMHIEIDVQGL